jgi:cytochrome c oxidase assembly factor CtaG
VTWLPVAGLLYTANLWLWHHPLAYEAALRSDPIHDVEHLAFFGSAILFWWPLVNPAPRRRWPSGGLYYGARIAYLILATAQNTLLGAIIGLTERVLYRRTRRGESSSAGPRSTTRRSGAGSCGRAATCT